MFDLTFKHPFTCLAVGPTSAGKTVWLMSVLREKHKLISPLPKHIFLFYSEMQPVYKEMSSENLITHLIQGIPPYDELKEMVKSYKGHGGCLLIMDDALNDLATNDLQTMFIQGSHHLDASIICVSQQLFFQSKQYRTMSINSHYLVLFKSPRENRQIQTLASQVSPKRASFLVDAITRATRQPFSYVVLDFKQNQSDSCRVRSNLFAKEAPPIVFIQKSL